MNSYILLKRKQKDILMKGVETKWEQTEKITICSNSLPILIH